MGTPGADCFSLASVHLFNRFFFSFALSLGELNSTMMIADETVRTLPLEIYGAISAYRFSYASALAVILLLMSLVALLLMEKILFQEEQAF